MREVREAEESLQLKLGGCSGEKGRRSNTWDMDERMRGWRTHTWPRPPLPPLPELLSERWNEQEDRLHSAPRLLNWPPAAQRGVTSDSAQQINHICGASSFLSNKYISSSVQRTVWEPQLGQTTRLAWNIRGTERTDVYFYYYITNDYKSGCS